MFEPGVDFGAPVADAAADPEAAGSGAEVAPDRYTIRHAQRISSVAGVHDHRPAWDGHADGLGASSGRCEEWVRLCGVADPRLCRLAATSSIRLCSPHARSSPDARSVVERDVAKVVRPDRVGLLLALPARLGAAVGGFPVGGTVVGPLPVFDVESTGGEGAEGWLVVEAVNRGRCGLQVVLGDDQLLVDGGEPLDRVGLVCGQRYGRSSAYRVLSSWVRVFSAASYAAQAVRRAWRWVSASGWASATRRVTSERDFFSTPKGSAERALKKGCFKTIDAKRFGS